jgi:hypothetical protein
MTVVGYARVSSLGQDLTVQVEKLSGCDKVFKEKRSGVDAGRPGSPSAPLAKLSTKMASASLTPRPPSTSDGMFAIVRWSISTRLSRRSSSPWSVAAISASRACSHSIRNATSSFVVKCDFLGIGPPSTQHAQVRTASHRNSGGEGWPEALPRSPVRRRCPSLRRRATR